MLVLTRKKGQSIILDFSGMSDEEFASLRTGVPVKLTVVELRSDHIRVGFDAPLSVKVYRQEVYESKRAK